MNDDYNDYFNAIYFADPGGESALRAGKREFDCSTCGEPNRLTKEDKRRGYQCDTCADAAEGLSP